MAEPLSVDWYVREVVRCREDLRKAREVEKRATTKRKRIDADLFLALAGMEAAVAQETNDEKQDR